MQGPTQPHLIAHWLRAGSESIRNGVESGGFHFEKEHILSLCFSISVFLLRASLLSTDRFVSVSPSSHTLSLPSPPPPPFPLALPPPPSLHTLLFFPFWHPSAQAAVAMATDMHVFLAKMPPSPKFAEQTGNSSGDGGGRRRGRRGWESMLYPVTLALSLPVQVGPVAFMR